MLNHRHGKNKNQKFIMYDGKKFNLQKKHSKKLYVFKIVFFFLYKFSKLLIEFYTVHKVGTFDLYLKNI